MFGLWIKQIKNNKIWTLSTMNQLPALGNWSVWISHFCSMRNKQRKWFSFISCSTKLFICLEKSKQCTVLNMNLKTICWKNGGLLLMLYFKITYFLFFLVLLILILQILLICTTQYLLTVKLPCWSRGIILIFCKQLCQIWSTLCLGRKYFP